MRADLERRAEDRRAELEDTLERRRGSDVEEVVQEDAAIPIAADAGQVAPVAKPPRGSRGDSPMVIVTRN